MDFEDPEELRKNIAEILRDQKDVKIEVDDDRVLQQLFNAVIACRKEFNWSNTRIVNKKEELIKFKEAWDKDKSYEPAFKFSSFPYEEEDALLILNQLEKQAKKIDRELISDLGFKEIDHNELKDLFRGIFEEYKLFVKLRSNVADREEWRTICRNIWRVDDETAHYANKQLQKRRFSTSRDEKNLDASDVSAMWKAELERLGMDSYSVEVKNVSGCHNVPENQKLVVAAGDNKERKYSQDEAKLLTVHEVFHAVRSYNGFKVVENTDLPPILGVHTPFYDRMEEGGAVYREFKTKNITDYKEKDYYLRTMAAHHWNQQIPMEKSVEKLIDLGASLKRAFALAARNREAMRHQIYLGGCRDWKSTDSHDHLMIGKVNEKWGQKFWKEINSNEAWNKPEVTAKKVFQSREFAFDA